MVINKCSWHYKLYKLMLRTPQNGITLCQYMRGLVYAAIMAVLLSVCVLYMIVAIGIWCIMMIDTHLYDFAWFPPVVESREFFSIFQTAKVGQVAVFIALCIGAGFLIGIGSVKYTAWRRSRTKRTYKTTLIGQWLLDKHAKVCRVVTFDVHPE